MADQYQVQSPSTFMYAKPDIASEPTNELIYGQPVFVLSDMAAPFVHVKTVYDGYEGYAAAIDFEEENVSGITHIVSVPCTHIYGAPNYKTAPKSPLYLQSRLAATDKEENGFLQLANGGWVFKDHLRTVHTSLDNPAETALQFLHTPYVWGGRTAAGLDCSGLVQIVMTACGYTCDRDTSFQQRNFGTDVSTPQKNDLVFFERHVGIMVDDSNVLNATSRHMTTLIEPLSDLEKIYGGILSIRRGIKE